MFTRMTVNEAHISIELYINIFLGITYKFDTNIWKAIEKNCEKYY